MGNKYGLFVGADASKCTGCKACEMACFASHNQKSNQVGKTVGTIETPVSPKLYVTVGETVSMPIQCKHCENSPCRSVCQKNAIQRVDGALILDEDKCIGCKDCMMACPFGAITLLPFFKNRQRVKMPDSGDGKTIGSKCDLCFEEEQGPACIQACPHEALRLVDVNAERKQKNIAAAEALAVINAEGRTL